jgi:hypothetical protein
MQVAAKATTVGYYCFPGFRPEQIVRGIFGDPKARVITLKREQEKEGFSIPAQLKLLRDYAAAQDLAVVKEYVDVETAKQTGRASFGDMVGHLRAHPSIRALLVEKTDRLYRNLKDWVTGAVAWFALFRKVYARHQGADGEELHRQSLGGSAKGHAGEGRAGSYCWFQTKLIME